MGVRIDPCDVARNVRPLPGRRLQKCVDGQHRPTIRSANLFCSRPRPGANRRLRCISTAPGGTSAPARSAIRSSLRRGASGLAYISSIGPHASGVLAPRSRRFVSGLWLARVRSGVHRARSASNDIHDRGRTGRRASLATAGPCARHRHCRRPPPRATDMGRSKGPNPFPNLESCLELNSIN